MIKGLRRFSRTVKIATGSDDDDLKRLADMKTVLDTLRKATASYTKKAADFSLSSMRLSGAMHKAYPSSGPLVPALTTASNEAPFNEMATSAAQPQEVLTVALSKLERDRLVLKEDIKRRIHLHQEMVHYQEKLTKLQANVKKQHKVATNRAKLDEVTAEHAQLHASCQQRLQALDATVQEEFHTPFTTVLQWQARHLGRLAAGYNTAAVDGAATPRPVTPRAGGTPASHSSHPSWAGSGAGRPGSAAGAGVGAGAGVAAGAGSAAGTGARAGTGAPVPVLSAPPSAGPAGASATGSAVPAYTAGPGVTVMIATAAYAPSSEQDIELKPGDIFLRTSDGNDEFSFGRIGDAFGEYRTTAAKPCPNPQPKAEVHAIYKYTTEDNTELAFDDGARLGVITDSDEGWWLGVSDNRIGYFPSNYVATK